MNNTTVTNSSDYRDYVEEDVYDLDMVVPITIPICVLAGVTMAVACLSGLLNCSVLFALSRVERSTLTVKHLIQNTTVSNMLSPIILAIDLPLILSVLKVTNAKINLCCWAMFYNVDIWCACAQVGCTIALSCDRIYASAAPMVYHTVGYKPWLRRLIVAAPWVVALGIWSSFLFVTIASSPIVSTDAVCDILYDTMILSTRAGDIYLISINAFSFLVYIGIFVGLKYQRAGIKKASDSRLDRRNLSLVVSYFLINITTLCLYLPYPIYLSYVDWSSLSVDEFLGTETIARGLGIIYLCNSVIDPLILSYRIPSIRQNLPFNFFACFSKK